MNTLLSSAFLFIAQAMPMQGQQPAAPPPLPHPEIQPPELPVSHWPWWVWALIALALILMIWGLVEWLMRERKAAPMSSKRPVREAMDKLRRLRDQLDQRSPADIGHEVSAILRNYYLMRYGLPAPTSTTEELFPPVPLDQEPLRRRQWRERFESLAALYDTLSYAPAPSTKNEALDLIDSSLAKLEQERLHEDSPAA